MANLFDKYVASPYIPMPFEQMAQAGQMQQQQYDKSREYLEQMQDKVSDMKVRPVDVEYKNRLLDETQKQALDIISNNKYYSPDMWHNVRSAVRKSARDPRLSYLGAAYENYNKERAIEDQFRVQGKDYFWNHRKNLDTPLYDNQGNLQYDPTTEHLGIEERLDATKAAMNLTSHLTPYITKSKGIEGSIEMKRPDGSVVKVPTVRQAVTSILSSADPRVRKDVADMSQNFLQSAEGRQWARLNATNPDGSVDQNKVLEFMLGTVAEKKSTADEETILQGLASIVGKSQPVTVGSPFYASAYNFNELGQEKQAGQAVKQPYRSSEKTTYKDLSEKERVDLWKKSKTEYENFKKDWNKNRENAKGMSGEGVIGIGEAPSYTTFMEQHMGSVEGNPYGSILTDYLDSKKESSQKGVSKSIEIISPEQSFTKFAEKKVNALTSGNTFLLNDGENSMQPMTNVLEGADIQNYDIVYDGHNAKVPTIYGGNEKMAMYKVYLPAEKVRNIGLSEEALAVAKKDTKVINEDGKSVKAYAVSIGVPMDNITSWQDAKEFDYEKFGPDKQIADDQSYKKTHVYHRAMNTLDKYNIPYQASKLDDTGNVIEYMLPLKGGKNLIVTTEELSIPGEIENIINTLQNAR